MKIPGRLSTERRPGVFLFVVAVAAAALAFAVAAFVALFLVVAAVGVRIVREDTADQRLDCVVRKARDASVDLYARHTERLHRAGAYPAADERLHPALRKEGGKRLMPGAGGVHDLCGDDFAVFYICLLYTSPSPRD